MSKHRPSNPAFEALIRQFIAIGRAHIDFEETRVWPGVRLALSEQELDELGAHLEQAKRLAPTRPHPNVPPTPEVLKVAAPIAGATDKDQGRPGRPERQMTGARGRLTGRVLDR
jgi:hypothetical protein